MSAETYQDGEVGRNQDVAVLVHPDLQDFFESASRVYTDALETGVISYSDEQLERLRLGLEAISVVVANERQRRLNRDVLLELFGTEPAASNGDRPQKRHDHETGLHVVHEPVADRNETTDQLEETYPEPRVEPSEPSEDVETEAEEPRAEESATEPAHEAEPLVQGPVEHDGTYSIRLVLARTAPGTVLKLSDFMVDTPLGNGRSTYAASQMFRRYVQEFLATGQLIQTGKRGAGTRYLVPETPGAHRQPEEQETDIPTPVATAERIGGAALALTAGDESTEPAGSEVDTKVSEQTQPVQESAEESIETAEPEEAEAPAQPEVPQLPGEVIELTTKGLGVHCRPDGRYEVVMNGEPVKGLEEFGKDAAFALLSLGLRVYSPDVRINELATLVERLGGEGDRHRLSTMLQKLRNQTYQNGAGQLLRYKGGGSSDSWSLTYATTRGMQECIEVLRLFGLNEKQAQRFLV